MRSLRPVLFGLLGFCSAIVAYLFSPGQWLNRAVALMLCGVLTADHVCLVPSLSVGAAVAVAESVDPGNRGGQFLVADRSNEFDDNSGTPATPGNTTPPFFPEQPGPNQPLRSPDFDDAQSNVYQSPLVGLWIYSLYEKPDAQPLFLTFLNIDIEKNQYIVNQCRSNCSYNDQFIRSQDYSAENQSLFSSNNDLEVEIVKSIYNNGIWGKITNKNLSKSVYLVGFKVNGEIRTKSLDIKLPYL
jgi:hypothetical protein